MRPFTPNRPRAKAPDRFAAPAPPTPLERSSASAGATTRLARRATGRSANRTVFPRRRRPLAVVRRLVLLVVLAAALGLVSISYKNGTPGPLRGPQKMFLDAVAPVEHGATAAWQPLAGVWNWTTGLVHARNENRTLRDRLNKAESHLTTLRAVEDQDQQLRAQLGLKDRGRFPADYRDVSGEMISRSPSQADASIVIDLGTNDGVAVGDPVMVSRGLIGRVESAAQSSSSVGLLTNPSEAVSATVVGRDGASGVLQPVSDDGSPEMELAYVPQSVDVRVNDQVVTSGWSTGNLHSLYPADLPLGVVSNVGNNPADVNKDVQVTPDAEFTRIDVVTVLEPTGAATTTFTAPPPASAATLDQSVSVPAAAQKDVTTKPASPKHAHTAAATSTSSKASSR